MTKAAEELKRCREWIEGALRYSGDTHTFADIVEALSTGKMQLWAASEGCHITEIQRYPKKKVLHGFLAGGKLDQLVEMQSDMFKWGKAQGCVAASIAGRKGWERVLKSSGWKPLHTVLTKEFKNE